MQPVGQFEQDLRNGTPREMGLPVGGAMRKMCCGVHADPPVELSASVREAIGAKPGPYAGRETKNE
jgi:hypothetical protein